VTQTRSTWFAAWWRALVRADEAGRVVLGDGGRPGFGRFLVVAVTVLYAIYGWSMGLFRGGWPGVVSGLKLPFLFLSTLALCFAAFYVLNCYSGLRLRVRQCARLLLLATSANAVALASYTPISLFFTLTTSRYRGYLFITLMHVAVFALAGAISVVVIFRVFRATSALTGRRIRSSVAWTWGVLYAFVGSEMAWTLRPWIGWWGRDYHPFRPLERSFVEALWFMIEHL
jgi:hypothetical protein